MRLVLAVLSLVLSFGVASSASAGGFGFKWSDAFKEKVDNIKIEWEKKYDGKGGSGTEWDWDEWKKDEGDSDSEKGKGDWEWEKPCLSCGGKDEQPKSAIPEPTAAFLFAGGAAVIAMRRRRNR